MTSSVRSPPPPPPESPSTTDGFVAAISQRLGGPIGRHAGGTRWWNPARIAFLVGLVVYLAGTVFRLPCRITAVGQAPDHFKLLCYSDIGLLYPGRGLMQGNVPYLDSGNYPVLEYPVLTGWFLDFERRIAQLLGAPIGSSLTDQQKVDSTLLFVDVNMVVLGLLFGVTIWAQVRTVPGRPWDVMMLAASPCVAAAALINWDFLPIALTALGVMFWASRKPGMAGVMLGLGMAAKLYPVLLLGPLFLLCLRSRRLNQFAIALGTFAVSWTVANLPALILAPREWLSFWTFNSERGGDLGSIWYVFSLAGAPVPSLNLVSGGLFALACLAIGALILLAPRRPRFGSVAFLVIAAFLMTNKVYSPQYVLWLLPLMILARPRWRDWLVFTAGELIYFLGIWWHLGGLLSPGDGSPDRVYWLAVLIRLGTEAYVVALVVRDVWRPEYDPVRMSPEPTPPELVEGPRRGWLAVVDDPSGGVLDGAPDAAWLRLSRAGTAAEVSPRRAM